MKVKRKPKIRCSWVTDDPVYIAYHDREWGVPVFDDRIHYEHIVLEGAQAGLSWLTILKRREHYRKAFAEFDFEKVARFGERDVTKLLKNPGLIRNELKIRSAVHNATAFVLIVKEFGSFSDYIWSFVNHRPKMNRWKTLKQIPAASDESRALSKDLKRRGFKFVGEVTMYAHMQACGLIHDHTTDCFRYGKIS